MIWEINQMFRFDQPEAVSDLNEDQRKFLVEAEQSSKLQFIFPPEIKHNKDKHIYKIGFIAQFLKRLYPEESFSEICKIMSDRYDVFIGRRQIDRTLKKFQEDSN